MKERDAFLLRIRFKIDQEVAADDQIKTRKRRVGENILFRKDDVLPHSLLTVTEIPSSEYVKNFRMNSCGTSAEMLAGYLPSLACSSALSLTSVAKTCSSLFLPARVQLWRSIMAME